MSTVPGTNLVAFPRKGVTPTPHLEPPEMNITPEPNGDRNRTDGLVEDYEGSICRANNRPEQAPENGSLDMPIEAAYGWLADHAKTLDAPRGWSYVALMTVFASQGINVNGSRSNVRPTLFSAIIGRVQDGKSLTMDRAISSVILDLNSIKNTVPGSDRGLQKIFAAPDNSEVTGVSTFLLHQDELKSVMSKIAIKGSTLATTLCTLWSKDEGGSADKTGEHRILARINILGGLPCASPEEFSTLFGAETCAGLYSRLILVPPPEADWNWNFQWRPFPVSRKPSDVKVPSAAFDLVADWVAAGKTMGIRRARNGEIALRVALISASANGDRTVTQECIAAALKFAEWQERVQFIYRASSAENPEAEATNAILDNIRALYVRQESKDPVRVDGMLVISPDGFFRWRQLERCKGLTRKYGGSLVGRIREALIQSGLLDAECDSATNKRTGRYSLPKEA